MRKFLETLGSVKKRFFPASQTSAAQAGRPRSRLQRFEQLEQRTLLSITSEGLAALNIDLADSFDDVFGRFPEIRGSEIRVGVIADGYTPTDEMPDITASSLGSGAEGTAMLEIIHDIAPQADLWFAPANSEADFESAVDYLSGQGVDVIVAAPWLRGQPWFEDGPAATAASAAAADGIVFVSAAGDDGEAIHYQGAYSPFAGHATDEKLGAHDFGGSDLLVFDIPAGGAVDVDLQWSTPWGQSTDADDLNLYLYKLDGSSTTLVAWSDDQQVSPGPLDDPVESLTYKNGPEGPVQLAIQVVFRWAEFVPAVYDWPAVTLEIFATGDVSPASDAHGGSTAYTVEDRIFGPAAVSSVITVGAANYDTPDSVAPDSSHGPSTVLDGDGPGLTVRESLDGVAIDNVSYSGGTASGTAIAAAHAGGIAALALQMNPNLSPAEIQTALTTTAVDLGSEGYDNASGHGRFDALAALYEANPLALPDRTAESDRGYRNDDNITNTLQGPLEITGQVAPGAAVALFVDGQPFLDIQTTADAGGNYSFTIDPQELSADILAQLEGFHAVSVEVTHSSLGDSPVRSPALHLTIDNTPPTIASVLPLASPDPLDLSSSNDIDVDVALSEAVVDSLGLSGLLPANLLLSGRAGGTVGTPESLEDNTWRFPITSLGEGALALSLQNIEDLAGNPLVADAWGYGIDLAIAATDADKLEGHDGETPFTFTVTRTGDLRDTTTVDWQFAHDTTDDADFGGTEPAGGTLTFAPGASTQTITVYVSGDTDFELDADKTFTVSLANASTPAAIAPGLAQATGTIRNDDYNPEMPLEVSTLLDGNDQDYSPGNLSLREALALAKTHPYGSMIAFDPQLVAVPDPRILLTDGELLIDRSVNIQGLPGLTIDAGGLSRAFRIGGGANATISDLAVSGGYSDYLAGALWVQNANLTLLGVNITGSTAEYGGAIFAYHNATVTLDGGTTLSGNTAAVRGGALYMYGAGSVVNLLDATITGNTAGAAGGAVAVHNDALLSLFPGSAINNNQADLDRNIHIGWKGLVSTELVVTTGDDVDDTDYTPGNLSLREALRVAMWQPGSDVITFAPDVSQITLAGSELAINSDVEIQGPGISGLTIDADNKSRLFRVDAGVAATIRDLTLSGGYADYLGGAITTSGAHLTLSGVKITGSQAPYGGAIFAGWNGTVTLDGGTQFVGNEALVRGGAIYMYGEGTVVEVRDATITDNVAGAAGGAIAIHNDAVLALLPGSVVSQNEATSDANIHVGWKGLLSTELIVTTGDDVDDTDYTPGNLSLREALRIAKWQPGSDVITFAPDVSQIILAGSELAITSDVEIQGPGINALTIDADNKSRLFRVDAGVAATIRDLTLTGGYADYLGGAITTSGAHLTLSGVKITASTAEYGGAIFAGWNGTLVLDGGTQLVGNEALVRGGAIYMYGEGAVVEVRDATITGNRAGAAGGAIAIHNAALLKWFVDAGGQIAGNETSTNKDPDIHIGWAGLVDKIYGAW